MRTTKSIFYYSLLATLVAGIGDASGAIRVGNKSRSYAAAYDQVNAIRNPAPVVMDNASDDLGLAGKTQDSEPTAQLPIRVANPTLASQIAHGDAASVTFGQLQNCGAVYPNGEFAWDMPTAGTKNASGSQCVSVVEMRGYQMGENGSDLVLARINLAAGDSIKCNVSEWPESSYLPSAGQITFPNDAEPTVEDVIDVMNQEQKQHAGLKIAAGALVAAVAGNMAGDNAVGHDSLLGTNKEKLQSTAIGGITGAAIMAGNVYAGKVAGDMILSAGVNAAAGGLIGNMAASGDSVIRIEDCMYQGNSTSCLWGMVVSSKERDFDKRYFYDTVTEEVLACSGAGLTDCKPAEMISIIPAGYIVNGQIKKDTNGNGQEYDLAKIASEFYKDVPTSYRLENNQLFEYPGVPNQNNSYVEIVSGVIPDKSTPAVIVGVADKAFGFKKKDWADLKKRSGKFVIMGRGTDGQPYEMTPTPSTDEFYPMYVDAEDGGLIDLGNKARLKGTLIGAGAGGAMGAFTAYQGAQDDIQERWVAAVREYKDSLQKVYCATGKRFLTHYNDLVTIPKASE